MKESNKGVKLSLKLILVLGIVAIMSLNFGCSKASKTATQTQAAQIQVKAQIQTKANNKSKTKTESATPTQTKPRVQKPAKSTKEIKSTLTYTSDIKSILAKNCVGCHNPKGSEPDIPLDNYDKVVNEVEKGDPSSSNIVLAVDGGEMNGSLTADQLKLLKEWVKQGAVK